ncbi:SDR family NAD(P)-dependent oxidoreductase [Chitinophaga silvatica]|uniref:SDR family NAD(P)-dependent oxidoreductase n=1 Tax=Chitinophaga silvatica TaxID=2282649 RepID=A0A3E1Y5T1_9BACT|nr:glucose 1-dehydrogenase [Chitinophaga silvatica]RFS20094.1 SDR family NAD(P)-dependent oxidoreductase [Chitinophaga silvatica]
MVTKTVLITGGATGIGKQTALKLASEAVNVVISGRRADVGAETVKEIESVATNGARVLFIKNDVTNEAQVKEMIDLIVTTFGSLDLAVNNAGLYNESATLNNSDSDSFKAMIDTNIMGVYYCMKYEINQMLKQGKGAIVNLASIAGLNGIPFTGTYCATKHAVVGLTKAAALDHAAQGIRINAIAPGAARTAIIAKDLEGESENYDADRITSMFPMHRIGDPKEMANGIAWLLSDEASFVTGHILSIDGGFQAK